MIINISIKTAFLLVDVIFRVTSTKLNSCNKSRSANKDIKIKKTLDTIIFLQWSAHYLLIVEWLYIVYDERFFFYNDLFFLNETKVEHYAKQPRFRSAVYGELR